jgi:hypothetical protein
VSVQLLRSNENGDRLRGLRARDSVQLEPVPQRGNDDDDEQYRDNEQFDYNEQFNDIDIEHLYDYEQHHYDHQFDDHHHRAVASAVR